MNRVHALLGYQATLPNVTPRRAPGDLFLHPLPIVAAATVAINDAVLKTTWPGTITGKLSDVAGLFIFPIILVCVTELVRRAVHRPWSISDAGIVAACVLTGVTFAVVKSVEWASTTYGTSIGVLRWPLHAVDALIAGNPVPAVVPIEVVRDPTDIVAVTAVIAAGLWMHYKTAPRAAPEVDGDVTQPPIQPFIVNPGDAKDK